MGYLIAGYLLCSVLSILSVYKADRFVTLNAILFCLLTGPVVAVVFLFYNGDEIVVFGKRK